MGMCQNMGGGVPKECVFPFGFPSNQGEKRTLKKLTYFLNTSHILGDSPNHTGVRPPLYFFTWIEVDNSLPSFDCHAWGVFKYGTQNGLGLAIWLPFEASPNMISFKKETHPYQCEEHFLLSMVHLAWVCV